MGFLGGTAAEYDSCDTAVLEPPLGRTCLTACESGSSDADSPWLPRPRQPHGAGRTDDTLSVTVHQLLTVRDVARVLNIGERTVWRMTSRAETGNTAAAFPRPVRIGKHAVRWRWQDLKKYLEELAGK